MPVHSVSCYCYLYTCAIYIPAVCHHAYPPLRTQTSICKLFHKSILDILFYHINRKEMNEYTLLMSHWKYLTKFIHVIHERNLCKFTDKMYFTSSKFSTSFSVFPNWSSNIAPEKLVLTYRIFPHCTRNVLKIQC